jgi:hypothetical protein
LRRGLALGVARSVRFELLIHPGAVEKLHQRPVQHVDPDHRLLRLIAVVVPGAVRREDDVAARRLATLALDVGVAALLGEDGAAGVRRVNVCGCDVARIVDRDRATDGVGDLQATVEARIGQQDALPVGEIDRRHISLGGDGGQAIEVGLVVPPAPAIGGALHLVGAHAAARHQSGSTRPAGVGEPWALSRRIHLGANPDVVLCGIGVDFLHQLARLARKPRTGWGFLQGHDAFLLIGAARPPISA